MHKSNPMCKNLLSDHVLVWVQWVIGEFSIIIYVFNNAFYVNGYKFSFRMTNKMLLWIMNWCKSWPSIYLNNDVFIMFSD